jgi:hypothetical protein
MVRSKKIAYPSCIWQSGVEHTSPVLEEDHEFPVVEQASPMVQEYQDSMVLEEEQSLP